ncbi:hypothetical protein AURANDRAFT_67493 [Aureococcus anophagefferens]|uniref:Uncharacterized protein n=1 Tax=Aureococcus anophagefferens TaxID=44056 RepID=F0YLC4_AURAN|nr:hypothetical protein AURANDRAFT_67493 [Aureococcus anophagefferens]EGB04105.1 hypothetical protein AURANDRAFT_67493 [Aureococcus anophagefferens]|eukprot:XP_009041230.1 hypothetical protein AURANDRAFT_67493 [Aureococcus anophagefferens]
MSAARLCNRFDVMALIVQGSLITICATSGFSQYKAHSDVDVFKLSTTYMIILTAADENWIARNMAISMRSSEATQMLIWENFVGKPPNQTGQIARKDLHLSMQVLDTQIAVDDNKNRSADTLCGWQSGVGLELGQENRFRRAIQTTAILTSWQNH